MKMLPTSNQNRRKRRPWFQRQRPAHDPMLVLNMSIFNAGTGWERVFTQIAQRENVWT